MLGDALKVGEQKMQAIQKEHRALSLIMELNWDRALYIATIFVALCFGAWLGSL